MSDDAPFVTITNREIWKQLEEQGEDITEIRGDVKVLLDAGGDREKRIRKLELRYYAILAGLVVGFAGSATVIARGLAT
jgi:hypothetical protein